MRSLEWSELRFLRLRAQFFTGYSLLHFTRERGTHSTDPIPAYFDMRIPEEPDAAIVARWDELTAGLSRKFIYAPPAMLGEVGWWRKGILLNEDTVTYQERLSLLCAANVFKSLPAAPRIIEIGGGYGALASAITAAFPKAEYWICDLPESLLFAGLYLTLTRSTPVHFPRKKPGRKGRQPAAELSFSAVCHRCSSLRSCHQHTVIVRDVRPSDCVLLRGPRRAFRNFRRFLRTKSGQSAYRACRLQAHRRTAFCQQSDRYRPHFKAQNGVADIWHN